MDNGPVIQVRELTKRFGPFTALDRLTMDVEAGRGLYNGLELRRTARWSNHG